MKPLPLALVVMLLWTILIVLDNLPYKNAPTGDSTAQTDSRQTDSSTVTTEKPAPDMEVEEQVYYSRR